MLHTYQDVVIATTKNYVEDVLKTGINRTIAEHVANLLGFLIGRIKNCYHLTLNMFFSQSVILILNCT